MTVVREGMATDAPALHRLKLALDRETDLMLLEPGERGPEPEPVPPRPGAVVLVADDGDELAGYVEATRGGARRIRHRAEVVIGVRASRAGRGIGTALLAALDDWARASGVERLELTVMRHNERAQRLYRRMGYEVEGTRRDALRVGGRSVDELYMAKLLPPRG